MRIPENLEILIQLLFKIKHRRLENQRTISQTFKKFKVGYTTHKGLTSAGKKSAIFYFKVKASSFITEDVPVH